MAWMYNEDSALKLKLQGLLVADANNPTRQVPVRFRLPEDELATLSYPVIIIEHRPVTFRGNEQHRGFIQIPYAPEGYNEWFEDGQDFNPNSGPYSGWFPIAVNLNYAVTIYTRKMAGHLQPLMAQLSLNPYLPFQFGFLKVPQDGTIRSMFVEGGTEIEYGKDKDNKRLFRTTYLVRVVSEVLPEVLVNGEFGALVTQVNVDFGCYSDVTNLTEAEVEASFSLIQTGPAVTWNVAA
jgi:hypothetical protein